MDGLGWVLIIVIAYMPIFYRIHRRLNELEDEMRRLKEVFERDTYH